MKALHAKRCLKILKICSTVNKKRPTSELNIYRKTPSSLLRSQNSAENMAHMMTRSPLWYQPEEKWASTRFEKITNLNHLYKQVMPLATSEDAGTINWPSTGIGGLSSSPGSPRGIHSACLPKNEPKSTNQSPSQLSQDTEKRRLAINQASSNKSKTRTTKQSSPARSHYMQQTHKSLQYNINKDFAQPFFFLN